MLSVLALILLQVPSLSYTPPPAQPVTIRVYPGYWEDENGRHDFDPMNGKYPLAAALTSATGGDVIEVNGYHQGVDIGHSDGRRKVPSLDGVEIRGGEIQSLALGPGCGDLILRQVTFNMDGFSSGSIISDNVFSDAELILIECVFKRGAFHKKWDVRTYGRHIVMIGCQGYGAREWFLYAQNPVGGVVFSRCRGWDYGRGMIQLCTRYDSNWNSSGDWWLTKCRSWNSGHVDGAMAYTTAGLGGGGTVYMQDLKSFDDGPSSGAIICWGDKKQRELDGTPLTPIWQRNIVGPGWINDSGFATDKLVLINPQIEHEDASRAMQMVGHVKEVEVWGFGQRTMVSSNKQALWLEYQPGQPVESCKFYGREDPNLWPWYGHEVFKWGDSEFDPVLTPPGE